MAKKIPLFSLVLLIVAALDSIRNFPSAALFGSSLIFFFLLAALIFLIPIALVSAELTSRFHEEGGVFHWIRHAFGQKVAVLAIWLQWINTMVWYPTILAFIAGTAAYLYDPALAQNKLFLSSIVMLVFWGLTILNLFGIQVSARINSFCSIVGTLVPMAFLILLAGVWCISGQPVAISFGLSDLLPSSDGSNHWVSLIAIMASFLGMELAGVHVRDIENPRRNFPKAIGMSVLILLSTMILGSLSIAVVIPEKEIRLVDGIMQTFSTFFASFGLEWLVPILPIFIIIGSIGLMINWLISPAKGLLQAAELGYLPSYFSRLNRHGVATRILFAQAILVSVICLAIAFLPSINAFYWFLTDLSTELYMIMYVMIFLAALKLGAPSPELNSYRIPRGTRRLTCALGLAGCIVTIIVGYLPPDGIDVGSSTYYFSLIAGGNLLAISPVFLLWMYKKKARKR